MVKSRKEIPEEGDLLLTTVNEITPHGAYVNLDEYKGLKGFIHVSEIASGWVKNIRNFVRENQKVVVKVLRANKFKQQIDLSLRRVTEQQKKGKIQEWKRAKNADGILKLIAGKLKKTVDETYEEVGWRLEDKFGEIYGGLQAIKERGINVIDEAGISSKWRDAIYEQVIAHVELSKVKISALLELTCFTSDGIDAIKKSLISGLEELKKENDISGRIFVIGSPKYAFEVEAPDYKIAERVLSDTAEKIIKTIKSYGGEGVWKRTK